MSSHITAAASALFLIVGCAQREGQPEYAASQPRDLQSSPPEPVAYPRGSWRLARQQLPDVVLSVSHILIRHRASSDEDWVLFLEEKVPPKATERTRERALSLIQRLAARLEAQPQAFAEVAKENSDDRASAQYGGHLGFVPADRLPPPFLDALAAMPVGSISRVVETSLGFHLIRREPLGPETALSASEIIISHEHSDASLAALATERDRSRDEALALAEDLAQQARATSGGFSTLVAQHSDAETATRAGNIGTYSTYAPVNLGRELAALARLPVGGVTDPIESAVGFRVLQRTRPAEEPELAMTDLVLRYDPAATEGEHSRQSVRKRAKSVERELHRAPERFELLQREICCAGRVHGATEGRWRHGMGVALREVAIGELTRAVETPQGFHIMKRLDPSMLPPAHLLTELPSPKKADTAFLVANTQGRELADAIRDLQDPASALLRLSDDEARTFKAILNDAAELLEGQAGEQRAQTVEHARRRIWELLGPERFGVYQAFVQREVTSRLMEL